MQPTSTRTRSTKMRYAWMSPVVGVLILAFGLYYVATASPNVVELGVVDTALGVGWTLGSLLSVGIARAQ